MGLNEGEKTSHSELKVLFVVNPQFKSLLSDSIQDIFVGDFIDDKNEKLIISKIALKSYFCVVVENLSHLHTLKSHNIDVQVVWFDSVGKIELLEEVINKKLAQMVISSSQKPAQVYETLKKSFVQFKDQILSKTLLSDIGKQNKELESLTKDLESIVEERTFHIKVSESDEKDKINRIRGLIRFIKTLTSLDSFEEILNTLRGEIKRFHGLSDPMLYMQISEQEFQLVYFRSGRIYYSRFNEKLPLSEPSKTSASLANLLGRPMGKVLVFKLTQNEENKHSFKFSVLIEHQLEDSDKNLFIEFIEERKQALRLALERVLFEQNLSSSIYRWERTFDGIRDPISIIDGNYNLLRVNKAFSPRVNHKKCFANWNQGENVCLGCPVGKTLKTGKPHFSEVRRGDKYFSVISYPIRLSNNEVVSNIVNHYIDLTESRELYGRMIQSEKMGALGLLAGNIAHELNNPLTGIRSLAQVLASELPSDSALANDLMEIEKGARRSQEIIKNLLDFSQGQTEVSDVDLDDLVNKTLPMLKSAISHHRSEVFLSGGKSLIRVHAHLIQQVIFNLVNNACQAMGQQGLLVLKTEPSYLQHVRGVKLTVKDSGPGIAEEHIGKIFEPFFTTKKDGMGTGLGLSMAKSIIESFNGQIGVESKSGMGAEFWIWLPMINQGSV